MNEAGDTVNVALPWLLNGVFLGAGALLGSIINENIPAGEEEESLLSKNKFKVMRTARLGGLRLPKRAIFFVV